MFTRLLCWIITRHRDARWSRSQGNTRVCNGCGKRWRDRT